jgi:Kdo2-lipid IVA lauroyltransferase/acyltransferase
MRSTAEVRSRKTRGLRPYFKPALDSIVGIMAVALLKLLRLFNRKLVADFSGFVMRKIGPWLPKHSVGRNNLKAAFPEKSPEEIEQILAGTWDNLGRVAAEFVHLDRIRIGRPDEPGSGDVMYDKKDLLHRDQIRRNSRPAIFFGAHLANWEISAMVPPNFGFDSYVLYRPSSIPAINNAILTMRARRMGTMVPAGLDAPIRLAGALEKGAHVGMIVDQHFNKDFRGGRGRGVDVTFFGRPCKANPLLAHLAQLSNCEIRGMRIIRLRDRNTFWSEMTDVLDVPRRVDGKIDIQGTMQAITSVIEGWIREHPEQWLWLHRRWR